MFIVSNDVIQPLRTNIFLYFALLYPLSLLCPFSFFVSPSLSFYVSPSLSFNVFAALPFFLLLSFFIFLHHSFSKLSFTPSFSLLSIFHYLCSLSVSLSICLSFSFLYFAVSFLYVLCFPSVPPHKYLYRSRNHSLTQHYRPLSPPCTLTHSPTFSISSLF